MNRIKMDLIGVRFCIGFHGLNFFFGGGEKKRGGKNKVGKSLDFLTFGGLVIRLGLKPRTHSLEGCCSIQLSYRTRFFLA